MDVKKFIERQVEEIKETVGKDKAISALSGGVDSSVATLLAHRALGAQLKTIFIDHGLMREKEPEEVKAAFGRLGIDLEIVDARNEFSKPLRAKLTRRKKGKLFVILFTKFLAGRFSKAKPGT